jgi:hypothetical protein
MSADNPTYDLKACLHQLSKNISGKLTLLKFRTEKCSLPKCNTFKTVHKLDISVKTAGTLCDSVNATKLDGKIVVNDLVHGLLKDGNSRGYHRGKFNWLDTSGASVAVGHIWGITNGGTHRSPVKECETCNTKGHMEGRLLGNITSPSELKGCGIYASYLFTFESTSAFTSVSIKGTIEGLIECSCA